MNCPSNVSIPYGSNTTSWSEPTATDNAGPVTNAIRSHTPGSTFLDEITMVTYTFTDAQGNQANCVFLVIRLGGWYICHHHVMWNIPYFSIQALTSIHRYYSMPTRSNIFPIILSIYVPLNISLPHYHLDLRKERQRIS